MTIVPQLLPRPPGDGEPGGPRPRAARCAKARPRPRRPRQGQGGDRDCLPGGKLLASSGERWIVYPGCQPRLLLCIIRQTEPVATTAPAPQDMASVVAVAGQYVTVEKYIEAKNLLHIFKLGDFYRAMM